LHDTAIGRTAVAGIHDTLFTARHRWSKLSCLTVAGAGGQYSR